MKEKTREQLAAAWIEFGEELGFSEMDVLASSFPNDEVLLIPKAAFSKDVLKENKATVVDRCSDPFYGGDRADVLCCRPAGHDGPHYGLMTKDKILKWADG